MASTGQRIPIWDGTPADPVPMPMAIGSTVRGCMGCVNAAGHLVDGADTAGLKMAGICNGGGTTLVAGTPSIEVHPAGRTKLNNSVANPVLQAHVGDHAYVEDNDTVASVTVNYVRAGIVIAVEADGVWVDIRAEALKESPELEDGGEDEMDMTGMDADAMAISPTGAVGTVWDTAAPTTVVSAVDRIASETAFLPGGPIQQTSRLAAIYVNAATGLDTNPGTVASPVLTMDRAMELVPPYGFCAIYVTGDPVWAGGGVVPYEGYRGHLRIFATNAFTDAGGGADTVTAYAAAAGVFGQDTLTPTLLVPADATDRSRFISITEDVGAGGATHLVRVLEEITGVWQLEPRGLTVTGANAIALLEATSTLAPVAAISASALHHEGDVMLIGFNVTSPGADGLTGLSFAACVIDATADVHALNMGPNTCFGGISTDDAYAIAPAMYCPLAMLTGSCLENLVAADADLPGTHITMAGGASVLRMIASSAPGCGRIVSTVWEAGDLYVGNPDANMTMDQSRGILAASGIQVMDGAHVRMGDSQMGDVVTGADTEVVLTGDIGSTSLVVDGTFKAAGVGANQTVYIDDATKVGGSDTYYAIFGAQSEIQGITLDGAGWPAATALTAVTVDGISNDLAFALTAVDRGNVGFVTATGGRHFWGACAGDNTNVAGWGLTQTGLGTVVSAANGFALTGNGGGTTTIDLGSAGATALPAGGVYVNDFAAAGVLTGAEQCTVFLHRA